jgi:predicted lipoprotein with Yx(FWY)xxD motif
MWLGLRFLGAGLLVATGAVHLDLYLTGYRTIPTIGVLFLLQVISAFGLAVAILATGWRTAAAAGAGLSLSTLTGYLISLRTPLFSFREVRTNAGITVGILEVASVAALGALALRPSRTAPQDDAGARRASRRVSQSNGTRWAAGTLVLVAAVALAVSLSSTSSAPSTPVGSSARLDVGTIAGVNVLRDTQGFTVYWFSQDTPTSSACDATCTPYWHPVLGTPVAGTGVHGSLGTIHRGGGLQATYDGHPLYTYVSDSAPGQANGNNVTLNGGLWHEMTESGTT